MSVTSVWLSGVLWILSHSDLALRAQVVIGFRDHGMCLALIADLCIREGNVFHLRKNHLCLIAVLLISSVRHNLQ